MPDFWIKNPHTSGKQAALYAKPKCDRKYKNEKKSSKKKRKGCEVKTVKSN